MKSWKRNTMWIALVASGVVGCKTTFPPLPQPTATRARLIIQREFGVAAVEFGRQNVEKDASPVNLANAIPAALLRQMREVGRFSMFDGGGLRLDGPQKGLVRNAQTRTGLALNETTANRFVDAYLSGTLLSSNGTQVCFNVRLANAVNHEVLYAANTCVASAGDRRALRRLAEDISRSVKRIGNAQVKSVYGKRIIVDKGGNSGIIRGMAAYVVATGENVTDPKIHQQVQAATGFNTQETITAGSDVVVGELYVSEVNPDFAVCYMYKGDYLVPGDTVYFK